MEVRFLDCLKFRFAAQKYFLEFDLVHSSLNLLFNFVVQRILLEKLVGCQSLICRSQVSG